MKALLFQAWTAVVSIWICYDLSLSFNLYCQYAETISHKNLNPFFPKGWQNNIPTGHSKCISLCDWEISLISIFSSLPNVLHAIDFILYYWAFHYVTATLCPYAYLQSCPTTKCKGTVAHTRPPTFLTQIISSGISNTTISINNLLEGLTEFTECYNPHNYSLLQRKNTG